MYGRNSNREHAVTMSAAGVSGVIDSSRAWE